MPTGAYGWQEVHGMVYLLPRSVSSTEKKPQHESPSQPGAAHRPSPSLNYRLEKPCVSGRNCCSTFRRTEGRCSSNSDRPGVMSPGTTSTEELELERLKQPTGQEEQEQLTPRTRFNCSTYAATRTCRTAHRCVCRWR